MSQSITRTETDLLGSVASPATIAAAGTSTTTPIDLTSTTGGAVGQLDGDIATTLIIGGTAPTTAPQVQNQYSMDGTNYANDGGPYVCPNVASTTYSYLYTPPKSAKKAQVKVTNGATTAITAYAQGNTRAAV